MLQGLLGLPTLILLAWLASSDRRRFPLRLVIAGLAAQLILAALLLKLPPLQRALLVVNDAVLALEAATAAGTALVFGLLGGGPPPFDVTAPEHSFVLALRALPIVVVFAALSALLWHWRVIPLVIGCFARLLHRALGECEAASIGAPATTTQLHHDIEAQFALWNRVVDR